MNILCIRDDKPGHYNQSEGLLLSLKILFPDAQVEYCDVEIKSKLSRKFLRFLLNHFSTFFKSKSNVKYISYFYKKYSIPITPPDMIISTGGNTSNINAWFAYVYDAKNILNGGLRGLNEEHFTLVTTVLDLGYKNQCILDVAPNTITTEQLENEANQFRNKHHLDKSTRYFTLLIGGDGAGYSYDNDFYEKLADSIVKLSNSHNIKWFISTSRRTPIEVENILKEKLQHVCNYFVAYHESPEKILLPFLGLSTAVFVTEESASMISEAISARKPVYTLQPQVFDKDKNYQALMNKFEDAHQIERLASMETFQIEKDFSLLTDDSIKLIAEKLKKDFGPIMKIV